MKGPDLSPNTGKKERTGGATANGVVVKPRQPLVPDPTTECDHSDCVVCVPIDQRWGTDIDAKTRIRLNKERDCELHPVWDWRDGSIQVYERGSDIYLGTLLISSRVFQHLSRCDEYRTCEVRVRTVGHSYKHDKFFLFCRERDIRVGWPLVDEEEGWNYE